METVPGEEEILKAAAALKAKGSAVSTIIPASPVRITAKTFTNPISNLTSGKTNRKSCEEVQIISSQLFLTGFFDSLSERLVKKGDIVYSIFIEINIKEAVL